MTELTAWTTAAAAIGTIAVRLLHPPHLTRDAAPEAIAEARRDGAAGLLTQALIRGEITARYRDGTLISTTAWRSGLRVLASGAAHDLCVDVGLFPIEVEASKVDSIKEPKSMSLGLAPERPAHPLEGLLKAHLARNGPAFGQETALSPTSDVARLPEDTRPPPKLPRRKSLADDEAHRIGEAVRLLRAEGENIINDKHSREMVEKRLDAWIGQVRWDKEYKAQHLAITESRGGRPPGAKRPRNAS